ncbi:MAG: SufD family Fe-S cluster assembly protein [Actinomycetia bacterium]|nr:SufD family Fe-S cluster assembly protein [Actinomycetes bacterium]
MLSLDNQTLERLNSEAPSALACKRRRALEEYRRLQMPSPKEENWKYVNLGFDLDEMGLPSAAGDPLPDDGFVAALSNRAGSAVMVDGRLVGVINESEAQLGPSMEAAEGGPFPDLLTADTDKFAAAALAFSVDGISLRIPRNRAVDAPFVIDVQSTCPETVIFPSVTVQAEENSEATVVILFRSPDGMPSVVAPNLQTTVGHGARLSVTTVGLMGTEGANVMHHRSRIGPDATLRMGEIGLGGRLARMDLRTTLAGRGGSVEVVGLYYGEMQQVLDYRLVVNHVGPSTSSEVFLKGGVQDHAQSIFTGLLRIEEDAAGTSAFETNRNLVLSDGAKANSVPNLEILCNDVICGHGSSVGPLETEPLYYLMSRGISKARAERILVRGFFEEAIGRLPLDDLDEPARQAVNRRFALAQEGGRV